MNKTMDSNSGRYIIRISYDGTNYSGWQVQPNAPTIQGLVEDALEKLLKRKTPVTGAGRTDSGVNAINYVLHFDAAELPYDCAQLCYKLNAILPVAVCVHEIIPAPVIERPADGSFRQDWHARFSAVSREYHYFIHFRKDPFSDRFSWWQRQPLDVEKMNKACEYLLGRHDFSCFEKSGSDNKTSICTITEAHWSTYRPGHVDVMNFPCEDGDYIVFTIRANRFLRNMVRAIVGSMVEIGKGRQDVEWMGRLIESGDRCMAGESVPGKALFLSEVKY